MTKKSATQHPESITIPETGPLDGVTVDSPLDESSDPSDDPSEEITIFDLNYVEVIDWPATRNIH